MGTLFFIGKFNTIKTFIENLKESEITYIHEDLYKHLISLGMNLDLLPSEMKSTEVRPTTNDLYENNIDYDTIMLGKNEFITKYGKPFKNIRLI